MRLFGKTFGVLYLALVAILDDYCRIAIPFRDVHGAENLAKETACGHERVSYNSCRNRHCPKCQALSRARWLERESGYLLPVEYHHVVFTLPAELATTNASALYNLLMQSAAGTLREVAANPQRLGVQVGVLPATILPACPSACPT